MQPGIEQVLAIIILFGFSSRCFTHSVDGATCGSMFDDVASRTVLADTVVRGHVTDILKADDAEVASGQHYRIQFRVEETMKGRNLSQKLISVGIFGKRANRELCVAPEVRVESKYFMFFQTDDEDADSDVYRISAFPAEVSKKTEAEVLGHVCNGCSKWLFFV